MFNQCEFCSVVSERVKRLPFGNESGVGLVILDVHYNLTDAAKQMLVDSFPDAYILFRRACLNVENSGDGNLCCGILIRNIIAKYKIIVLPREMTKVFLGVEITGNLVEHKTGQLIIAYDGKPTAIEVAREYERAVKQC